MPASLPADPDYHTLFRSLPGLYLLLAPDGTIVDNSDDHVAASLLPREQAVGRNIFDAYPSAPESQRALDESHEYVRRHRQAHTMPLTRYDLQRPDGGIEERYWQITHSPILDPAGELRYILQQPHDVTTQHRAEQQSEAAARALAEHQDRTRFTLEALPVMVWTANPTGRIDYFNQRAAQFTGSGPDTARTIEESLNAIHPDDRARVAEARLKARESGAEYQVEYRLQRHDGQYRWLLARGVPRLDEATRAVRMWVGCAVDVHEQRQMVEELLMANEQQAELADQAYHTHQQAENQRRTFYDLFQQAPAMIAIMRGPAFVYEFVNPAYQQLFPDRELFGRALADAVPEAGERGFLELLEHVYRTGEPYTGNEVPWPVHRPGATAPTDVYLNFVYQAFRQNHQIVGLLCFAIDVTDLVMARRHLEALLPPTASN